jgi:hypothetical protein
MSLNDRIGALANLVGLILALITLLTANRASQLATLQASATAEPSSAQNEFLLDLGLGAVTTTVLLAGLPLWLEAVRALHPLGAGGPVRSVFSLAWILLVPLVAWQSSLGTQAWKLKQRLEVAAR